MSVEILATRKDPRFTSVMEEEDGNGSGSELGSSPGSKVSGSDYFKSVLQDYIFNEARVSKIEFERYKSKQQNKNKNCEEHAKSRRCESCQAVMAFCKCDMYNGSERKFGHRVHWADEVWNKPLTTQLVNNHSDSDTDLDEVDEHTHTDDKIGHLERKYSHTMPKPILKHKATCIVIVSE